MTDDIAALIERLKDKNYPWPDALRVEAANTLSRLTTPPPSSAKPERCAWPNCNPADQVEGRCCGWIESHHARPPPDEIAELIVELKARAHERAGKNSMVEVEQLLEWQAADALSRLTAPPPPDEIAELIERLSIAKRRIPQTHVNEDACQYLDDVAAALRALAQENARLHERLEDNHEFQLIDGKMTRVEVEPGSIPDGIECRDETIKLKREYIRELEADVCDAIRAKTIEECALEAGKWYPAAERAIRALAQTDEVTSLQDADLELQDAIRALAQTDEGKTETGE